MKKIFFLTALLCASMMSWAAAPVTGSSTENMDGQPGFTEGHGYDYSFSTEGTSVTISFTEKEGYSGLVAFLWNYTNDFAETQMTVSGSTASITLTNQVANTTLTFACKFAFTGGMSVTKKFTYTVPAPDKSDPELTLNETAVTLDASIPETFTILPERNGDGAISYLSNNTSIATVSEGGLVTAIKRGTTTITVNVASTGSYYAGSAELTVTVTGINWDAFSWVEGSDNKIKVAKAAGQSVINIQKPGWATESGIYTTFGAGISSCSLPEGKYAIDGAGMVLYLSAFTLRETEVTVIAGGNTFEFSVFNAGVSTAIDNTNVDTKTVKVIENGQLIIIKNGVKYNALGAELR